MKKYDPSNKKHMLALDTLKSAMNLNYQHHWIVDNMPVTWCYVAEQHQQYCSTGFPIGCYIDKEGIVKDACGLIPYQYREKDTYYIFNHVDIRVSYHSASAAEWGNQADPESGRIVCKFHF